MKKQQDYIRDIAEIRSMMERSSKFVSLSGWSGIMAGCYALLGSWAIYRILGEVPGPADRYPEQDLLRVAGIGILVFLLAISTAIYHSSRKAHARGERLWNPTAKRLLSHMGLPLVTGGLLICISLLRGTLQWVAPFSLIFYGLALVSAGEFTFREVRLMGLVQVLLGLLSALLMDWGLLVWAMGFGLVHLVYGTIMHHKYEK